MVSIIVTIAIAGLITWLITSFVPMPAQFKTAIFVVAGVCLLLYVLNALGLWGPVGSGHVRIFK